MIDLRNISSAKDDLDRYEVENNFQSWSFQPEQSPPRVVSAKGVRFTTEDGRERLDFSSCFVSHNIGHQDPRVVDAICEQARTLKEKHPCVGDVRGLGLFVGLELVKNKETREPLTPLNAKLQPGTNPKLEVAKKLGEMGMMAMAANPVNVIAMAPPLIISKDEIDEGIAIMDKALETADSYTG